MATVRVAQSFDASVHEAETGWYDTSRWPSWVEGLEQVVAVDGDWPAVGSRVRWRSGPAGRGSVTETVVAASNREALRATRGGALAGAIATHFIMPSVPGFQQAGGYAGPAGAQYDFLQHPAVEAEPGEFPVEIVIRRERGGDRCLHDFTPRARRARGGGRSPLAPLAGRAGINAIRPRPLFHLPGEPSGSGPEKRAR